jgi:hypothetical protein
MRYLLIIFLFLSQFANGQIINASQPYRPMVVASANLLLDDYPNAAAAYSLRKLDKDYTGSAIRVRRSSDNTEQDIGFTGNDLDTVALKNFVGANNGFVVTWYNQADSSGVFGVRNATQSTASLQPRIINSGTIERVNGKPAVNSFSNSVAMHMVVRQRTGAGNGVPVSWSFSVFNITSLNTVNYMGFELGTGRAIPGLGGTFSGVNGFFVGDLVSNDETINTTKLGVSRHGAGSELWINGTSIASSGATNIVSLMRILGGNISGHTALSRVPEIIYYNSDQSSNRTAIESNINGYYNIY